jgi:hypothetical protein
VVIVSDLAGDKPNRKQRRIKSPPQPGTLAITRVTVVDALGSELLRAERIADAVKVVELALHARAVASRDRAALLVPPPWIGLRLGVGSGEQVAHGDWSEAEEIPLPETAKASRRRAEPEKISFAEILGGNGSEEDRTVLQQLPVMLEQIRSDLRPERIAAEPPSEDSPVD